MLNVECWIVARCAMLPNLWFPIANLRLFSETAILFSSFLHFQNNYLLNFACGEVRGKLREVRGKLRDKCPKFKLEDCCLNSFNSLKFVNF